MKSELLFKSRNGVNYYLLVIFSELITNTRRIFRTMNNPMESDTGYVDFVHRPEF
jgi:hypothetical protein